MIRHIWKPVFALGAVLAVSGAASAGDRDTQQLAGGAGIGTTMTLGGKGTAAQAATEDNELTHGRRYGGYYGWGGGYGGYRGYYGGYRGSYYGGYRGGYYGGYGGYRSYYSNYYSFGYRPSYYYAPRVYYPTYYYQPFPVYTTYSYGSGIYLGIGGGAGSGAPTVPLGESFARPPAMAQPVAPGDGTFPYDGGPANPVPVPKADAQPIPPANPSSATDLPISLKPKTAPTPYKYKAYGEK
jgi:hypothetical protein